ncbi:MAG: hypothetical protein MJ138_01875 [Kiritimatiellae bacterium]|nr:hypothetical protein [Kiritimatiellia bacterium]
MKITVILACACACFCACGVETNKFDEAMAAWTRAETAVGPVRLAAPFRDGVVFAKDKPIRVFGTCASDGVTVEVSLAGKSASAKTANGRWLVELPPMPAGGPHVLRVCAGRRGFEVKDVRVGWVVVAAGQSNMAFRLKESDTPETDYADDPELRFFSLPRLERSGRWAPADGWVRAKAGEVGDWSAIGYLVGRELRRRTGEPVGVVNCNQGASIIQAWIPEKTAREPRFALKPEERHGDYTAPAYSAWNRDGVLYALDVAPFAPFAVSHVAWYQGESNTGRGEARIYAALCEALVSSWRAAFKDPELPFAMVQIADFAWRDDDAWRAVQQAQLTVPGLVKGVQTVKCSDVSDRARIHPPAKGVVARRLADAMVPRKPRPAARDADPAWKKTGPTKVMFFFDTEDFTCQESNDALRDVAKIFTEEGVVGEFNVVGYLAREIVRNRRQDVIDALKPHAIGTQTLKHSVHPTVCELTDMPDWNVAYANALRTESEGVGMLKAAFGLDHVDYAVPPGNSWSYASLYAFADMGMTFYGGGGFADYGLDDAWPKLGLVPAGDRRWGMWYCNLLQIPYSHLVTLEEFIPGPEWKAPDVDKVLDAAAKYDFTTFFMHPHIAVKEGHWDGPNYLGWNRVPYGKWIPVKDRPKADVERFYRNLREFVRRVKADKRFAVTDVVAEKAKLKARVPVRRADVPAVRKALLADFGAVDAPASWCVADLFQAAVAFLRGADVHFPGKVRGFLERPVGVDRETRVSAADLRAAARTIDLGGFVPPSIRVGDAAIGPADFLLAALEALETGAETVAVRPRDQLGSFRRCPALEHVDVKGGWCIHSPTLDGALLDERLKLQLWTLRFE